MKNKYCSGFTLIELLIAVALVVIIAPSLFVFYASGIKSTMGIRGRIDKLQRQTRIQDQLLETIRSSREVLYTDNRTLELWLGDKNQSGYPDRDETLTYEWSGIKNDPLFKIEDGARIKILDKIQDLEVTPDLYPPKTRSLILRWKQQDTGYFYSTITLRGKR